MSEGEVFTANIATKCAKCQSEQSITFDIVSVPV